MWLSPSLDHPQVECLSLEAHLCRWGIFFWMMKAGMSAAFFRWTKPQMSLEATEAGLSSPSQVRLDKITAWINQRNQQTIKTFHFMSDPSNNAIMFIPLVSRSNTTLYTHAMNNEWTHTPDCFHAPVTRLFPVHLLEKQLRLCRLTLKAVLWSMKRHSDVV